MSSYEKVFNNPYPDGWQDLPDETTPVTADALQQHTDAIEHIENYLAEGEMGTSVIPNPETTGDEPELNSIQIGDDKFKIVGGGSMDTTIVADDFDASKTYKPNDYCVYENELWRCLIQCENEIPVEGTYWKKVTIGKELTVINNNRVILSKEAYDLLPESKNTDGVEYFIYDWSQEGGSGSGTQYVYPLDSTPVVIGKIGNYDLKRRYTTSLTTQFTSKDVIVNVIGLFVNQNNQIVPANYYYSQQWFTEWYFKQDTYQLVFNKGSAVPTFKYGWIDYYTTE